MFRDSRPARPFIPNNVYPSLEGFTGPGGEKSKRRVHAAEKMGAPSCVETSWVLGR